MSQNIRMSLYVENKLRHEFVSLYMQIEKPMDEIINMFLDDVDYSAITHSREKMKEKVESWVKFYTSCNVKKDNINYKELKGMMKVLLLDYGFHTDWARQIFISNLITKGLEIEKAQNIANKLIEEIRGGDIEL